MISKATRKARETKRAMTRLGYLLVDLREATATMDKRAAEWRVDNGFTREVSARYDYAGYAFRFAARRVALWPKVDKELEVQFRYSVRRS